jgi:lipoate-protein ligase A
MAADESLLQSAVSGTASLRFYGWSPTTLSLGYFQREEVRHGDPRLAALPYVRRPSGGDTLVHHHEVTYALALPAGPSWQTRAGPWLRRMHAILAAALDSLGVDARVYEPIARQPCEGPLCFRHFTAGDLILRGAKVVGSAQRRHRGALLQHGALLLARSPHTPSLPGILELTGKTLTVEAICQSVPRAFSRHTGWGLRAADWLIEERGRIGELVAAKYAQEAWNRKR